MCSIEFDTYEVIASTNAIKFSQCFLPGTNFTCKQMYYKRFFFVYVMRNVVLYFCRNKCFYKLEHEFSSNKNFFGDGWVAKYILGMAWQNILGLFGIAKYFGGR